HYSRCSPALASCFGLPLPFRSSFSFVDVMFVVFFSTDPAATEISTLSLHDALPILLKVSRLKLPVIWLLVSMWLNTLTNSHITEIGRAVQQECRDRSRMPSSP